MIGRRSQLVAIGYQLYRVAAGTGGLLVILGAPGSARTALAGAAAGLGRQHGFEVVAWFTEVGVLSPASATRVSRPARLEAFGWTTPS